MEPFVISLRYKGLIFIPLFWFLLSCNEKVGDKEIDSDLNKMNLKGHVRSLCETISHIVDSSGIIGKTEMRHSDYRFNKAGNIVEHKFYMSDSTKWSSTICRYDKPGRLTEKVLINDELTETKRETWKYDIQGRLIEKADFNNLSNILYTERYNYNRENNEIEKVLCKSRCNEDIESAYNSEGQVRRGKSKQLITCQVIKMIYRLDEKGNRVEEIYFKTDDTPGARILNSFDEEGRKTEERHIRSDGGPGPWYRSIYDESGNLTEISSFNQFDSLFYRVIMRYDSSGRMTERWSGKKQNELKPDIKIKYNEHGDILEETRDFGARFSYTLYKYQYDEAGNWISRIKEEIDRSTGMAVPVSITEREIAYF